MPGPRQELAAVVAKAKAFVAHQLKLNPKALVLTAKALPKSMAALQAGDERAAVLAEARAVAEEKTPANVRVAFVCEPKLEPQSPGGKLLAKIIQAMGLKPSDAAVLAPAELEASLPRLSPKALVAMGQASAKAMGLAEADFGRLRGRFAEFKGLPLMPTHHPLELLESEGLKRHVWEDMKLVTAKIKS